MSHPSPIAAEITRIAADLSGYEPDELAPGRTFLQLGFDSLFLTQLATSISNRFETQVTFRSLFSEHPSIETLARHLEATVPASVRASFAAEPTAAADTGPEASAPPAQAVAPTPAVTATPASPSRPATSAAQPDSALGRLMVEQLQLMEQQLALLSGHAVSPGQADTPRPPTVVADPVPHAGADRSATPATTPAEDPEDAPIELPAGFGPGNARDGAAAIDDIQRAHLDDLLSRYVERTPGSRESAQRYREWHADPRTASGFNPLWKEMVYPIVVNRSKGARLWDVDGNEYIDLLNGFGPNFLGHSPDFITDQLIEQLRDGVEIGPQTPLAGETARMICEFSGMDRVTFVNTGSEAVQAALRVARTVTGRDGIVVFSGDYHGNFDEVLVRAVGHPDNPKTMPMAPGIPRTSVDQVRVLPYGEDRALELIEANAKDLAAVVVEPIQSRRPELQPREFLHRLREITEKHGIVLVFDEVITGFRCQPGGAQAFYGIDADIVTYGKIVGGGMPIGVVAGRKRYMDTFDGGFWQYGDDSFPEAGVTFFAGTFIRHPLTIRATHETVRYLLENGPEVYARVNASADWLCSRLNSLFERHAIEVEVPHCNSQIFVRVKETHPLAGLLFYHLRLRGIYIQEGFPCYLTDAHSREDLQRVVDAFEASVDAMIAAGIFGSNTDGQAPDVPPATTHPAPATPVAPEPEDAFPLTTSQMEIWLDVVAMDQAACAYNESDTLRLTGELDADRLRDCLDEIVQSHAAFRLRFGDQQQRIAADSGFRTAFIDLLNGETDPADALAQLRADMGKTPFDLEHGPVCRAMLVRTGENEHFLLFGAHHLVFDGWSADVLFRQLAERYTRQERSSSHNPPGFHQVADALATADVRAAWETSTRYWQTQLETRAPRTLELPVDHPRPPVWDYAGDTATQHLEPQLVTRLRDVASQRGVTMYAITLAAFRLLLARLANANRFVIGTSVSSQPLLDLPEVIGNGVNFIPVPTVVEGGMAVADLVDQAMDDVFSIAENSLTTLGELIQRVKCRRDLSRPVLAQAVFNYAPPSARLRIPGVEIHREENARSFVHFDLFANLTESDQGIAMDWDYPVALFDRETLHDWMDCYAVLLAGIVEALETDAARPLDSLDGVTAQSRQRMLQGWNATVREVPPQRVHEWVAQWATKQPDAEAVRCGDRCLTYAALDAAATALATRITRALGKVDGQPVVGLALARSEQLVVAILATWKAGCTYLPLDPGFPGDRLRYMAADAGTALLVVDSPDALPLAFEGPVLAVEDEDRAPAAADNTPLASGPTAYIIYTSGSTGQPKGVRVGHGPVRNLLNSMARTPGISAGDRLLAVTTLSFDISVLELLLPLVTGASVHIATEADTADAAALMERIDASDATVMQATPSTWRMLLDSGWTGRDTLTALCGGEPLPADLAATLAPRVASLWNMYGPTETTVWSTCQQITPEDSRISVGRPIDNTRVYILDERRQPVPRGVIGEIHIGGAGVAEGYHERPDLTAERFLDDPFNDTAGARMYRTGDLGRFLADGRIEHLGRVDNQVKVRGFRIELGEIETVLNEQPGIAQALARVFELSPGDQRLVAYLVSEDGPGPSTIALRKALRQRLPDYMIPQHFEAVDELPLTPNGKLDRTALALPGILATSNAAGDPPSGETQKIIAATWGELLGVSEMTTADNFFELGGHSLLAMRAIQQLATALGKRLPPQVLVTSTLADVAAMYDQDSASPQVARDS